MRFRIPGQESRMRRYVSVQGRWRISRAVVLDVHARSAASRALHRCRTMSISHPATRAQTSTAVCQGPRLTIGRLCCRLVSAGLLTCRIIAT